MDNSGRPRAVLHTPRAKRWWLLVLALLLVVGSGAIYLWKWLAGIRGAELLGFTSLYVAAPLAIGLLLLFAYFKQPPDR